MIVTDRPPSRSRERGIAYAWIEGGFKDFKRGQWGWAYTQDA